MIRFKVSLCFVTLLMYGILNAAPASSEGSGGEPITPPLSSLPSFHLDRFSVGIGGGLNYGGLGTNVLYYLTPDLAVYSGVGSDFRSANYSVGIKLRKRTQGMWTVRPYLIGTYGFNGWVNVWSEPSMSREFAGFAVGVGLDQKVSRRKPGYFTIAMLVPVRGETYHRHVEYVQQSGHTPNRLAIPVRLTFGYRFTIK